jgi:Golgi phosphoprotein 3 (GPP34)
VELADGIAVRVAALCLDARGRLSDRLICGHAVRGGLLLDLGLAGRLESTEDSILVDGRPTGFLPADRLLAAIEAEPERSLDGWLGERRLGLRDVAAAAVDAGGWGAQRSLLRTHFTDRARDRTAADRRRAPDGDPTGWSPADACVTAIAATAGLLGADTGIPPAVLAAAGPVAELCGAVVDHLGRTMARYAVEATGLGPF